MIYCLTGKIVKKTLSSVVISCGGVGYLAQVPQSTAGRLPAVGETATLYTVLNVTENDLSLYGFSTEEQRSCFTLLTGVSGVGPKAGLAILSVMSPEQVALAASAGDHKAFTKANGVGPKLAQRIALELKDKVGQGPGAGDGFAAGDSPAPARQLRPPPRRWPRWCRWGTMPPTPPGPSAGWTTPCRCRRSSRSPCGGWPGCESPVPRRNFPCLQLF